MGWEERERSVQNGLVKEGAVVDHDGITGQGKVTVVLFPVICWFDACVSR